MWESLPSLSCSLTLVESSACQSPPTSHTWMQPGSSTKAQARTVPHLPSTLLSMWKRRKYIENWNFTLISAWKAFISYHSPVHTLKKLILTEPLQAFFQKKWSFTESDRKKGTNGCLKELKCKSLTGTMLGAVGRTTAESIVTQTRGETPFLVLNRMAISLGISKIATLGVCTAFSLCLFSFQESANDLASCT